MVSAPSSRVAYTGTGATLQPTSARSSATAALSGARLGARELIRSDDAEKQRQLDETVAAAADLLGQRNSE